MEAAPKRRPDSLLSLSDLRVWNLWKIRYFRHNMKTLPILTFALIASVFTGYALSSKERASLFAQDEKPKPAAQQQPDTPNPPVAGSEDSSKESAADADAPTKPVLRRNEQTGAAALRTVQQARDRLISYRSVSANLVETVSMGSRRFRMKGSYLQGTDLKLRLEFAVKVGRTQGSMVEVCDGQILSTHTKIGDVEKVTRRNVRQILSEAGKVGRTPQNLLTAELGLGGLPGLMASLQKSVQFLKQWEQDVDTMTFVVVEGGWKRAFREKFLGPNPSSDRPLPPTVPDQVRVYYERESLFPRRILYLKQDESKVRRPMVAIDFVDVTWNGEVADSAFVFTPPEDVSVEDVTEAYLEQFKPPETKAQPAAAGNAATAPAGR